MQYSYINSYGDGARTAYQIPFPFIDGDHIFVTASETYTVVDQTLIFDDAPSGSFRIYRKTPPSLTTSTATMFRNEEVDDWRNILLSKVSQDDVDAAVDGLRAELLPEIALAQTNNYGIAGPEDLDPDEFPDPPPSWTVQPELVSDQQVNTYRRTVQFRWDVPDPTYSFCRITCPTDSIDRVVYGNEITFVDLSWTTAYSFTFEGYNSRGQATALSMGYGIAGFSVVAGPPLGIIAVDTINEVTPDHGVDVDGVNLKDSNVVAENVGVNQAVSADYALAVTGQASKGAGELYGQNHYALNAVRNTYGATTGTHSVARFSALLASGPTDGFGVNIPLGHLTSIGGTYNPYGMIRAYRNGADNTGLVQINAYTGGSLSGGLTLGNGVHSFSGTLSTSGTLTVGTSTGGGVIRIGRYDTGSEGGEIQFDRSSDGLTSWHIDAFASGLRIRRNATTNNTSSAYAQFIIGNGSYFEVFENGSSLFRVDTSGLLYAGTKVVGAQGAAVSLGAIYVSGGGAYTNTQLSDNFNNLSVALGAVISRMEAHGLIAT